MEIEGIHFITENRPPYSHVQLAAMALNAGIKVIQYRCKTGPMRQMLEEASQINQLCRAHQAWLIINDHLDLALALEARGVHLGQRDMPVHIARRLLGPRAIIGASAQNLDQARQAREQGASYLGYGPVFATVSKDDAGQEKGLAGLRQFAGRAGLPVIALGGVNEANLLGVKQAGAAGVAVISAISHAKDPQSAAAGLLQKWRCATPGDGVACA